MSELKEDQIVVQTPTSGSSSSAGLDIPDAMDGFFGYTEEKSLKQVFGIVISPNHTSKLELLYLDRRKVLCP
jgi:hypothetical protein